MCLEKEGGGGSMSRRRGIGNLVMWVGSFGGGGGFLVCFDLSWLVAAGCLWGC